jgi:hypothetical protein
MPSPGYPPLDKTDFIFLSFNFFKCILIVQGSFALAFQTCILHFSQINTITCSASITLLPLLFIILQSIVLYYLHTRWIFASDHVNFKIGIRQTDFFQILHEIWCFIVPSSMILDPHYF